MGAGYTGILHHFLEAGKIFDYTRILEIAFVAIMLLLAGGVMSWTFVLRREVVRRTHNIRSAAAYARTLIEASLDPLVTISDDGKILDVNEALVQVTGVPREQLIGTDFSAYFTEPEKARQGYQRAFAAGSVRDYPLAIRHTSGRETFVLYNATVYRDERGRVLGVFAAARDVTERDRLTAEVRRTASQLADILDNITDGVFALDGDLRYTSMNASGARMFGRTPGQLIGRRLLDEFPAAAETNFVRTFRRVAATGTASIVEEYYAPLERWLEARVYPAKDGVTVFLTDMTESERAEQEVKTILRTTIEGFYLVDLEGRILDANDAYCSMIGYSREELREIGVKGVEAIETEDVIKARIGRLLGRGSDRFETKHVRKDGRVIDIEAAVNLTRNPDRLFIFMRDITARKEADERLQASERRLAESQRVAHLGSWDLDLVTRKLDWSDETFRLFDQSPATFVPSFDEFARRVHADDRERMQSNFDRALASDDTPYHLAVRIINDSRRTWVMEAFGVVRRDANGTPLSIYGTAHDVTARRRADLALRDAQGRLESAMDQANLAYWEMDASSNIFTFNDRFYRLYATTAEREGGYRMTAEKYASVFVPAEEVDIIVDDVRRLLSGDIRQLQREHRILRRDGEVRDILVRVTVVRDASGRVVGTRGSSQDITERKRAEELVKESLRQKETLLREIHHRVKNNMQVVSSMLSLQSEHVHSRALKEVFLVAQQRVQAMALLHEKLYRTSDVANIDFAEYLRTLGQEAMTAHGLGPPRVEFRVNGRDVRLNLGQAVPCALAINELLTNAIKHAFPAARSGAIDIDLSRDGGRLVLTVRDNGAGLPADLDLAKTNSLGLQLVDVLARQLHGTFRLDNEGGVSAGLSFPLEEVTS